MMQNWARGESNEKINSNFTVQQVLNFFFSFDFRAKNLNVTEWQSNAEICDTLLKKRRNLWHTDKKGWKNAQKRWKKVLMLIQ